MGDLQVIIKMSELKEFEAKIAEANAKKEQHKATLKELEQLKNDLGGRKENVIRVEKHTTLRFEPSDRLARDVAFSVTNDAFKVFEKLRVFSNSGWERFAEDIAPKVLDSIEFSLRRYGYEEKYSEERSLEVMDLWKGSQEALGIMEAKVKEAMADRDRAKSGYSESYQRLMGEASTLREQLSRTQEENASLKATVQKLRDELRDALQPAKEEKESFLNKLINRL
jgi:chromosome segregation ATPase